MKNVIVSTLALLALSTSIIYAQVPASSEAALNFTADQQKQLKDIQLKQQQIGKDVAQQMQADIMAINVEIIKPIPDMAKINAVKANIVKIQTDALDNRINFMFEIKKAMTPDQFTMWLTHGSAPKS